MRWTRSGTAGVSLALALCAVRPAAAQEPPPPAPLPPPLLAPAPASLSEPAATVPAAPAPAAAPEPAPSPPAGPAPAPPHEPRWDASWTHADAWDYTLAGVGTAALIVELGVFQSKTPPLRWSEPILFDTDVRNALRTTDANTANTLENVSWGLWGAQVAYPIFVDVPYAWAHHRKQLAWDLFWQDAVTLTLAGAFDGALRDIVGRARPTVYDCLSKGGTDCFTNSDATRSFPGGHLVNATAASALTCTQHLYTELYGGPWDGVVCATTVASDLAITVMRVVSDNHWATDQIGGLALGGLIGWGVPYLMHFRSHGHRAEPETAAEAPSVMVLPMPIALDHGGGMGLTGLF